MDLTEIQHAVESVEAYFQDKADPGPRADTPATAIIEEGLRCRIGSPDGKFIFSDMAPAIGGGGSANSPGWLLRAALASCDATLLTIRAARVGLKLDSVEVRVEATSDGRGMFLDTGVSAGSADMSVHFKIGAPDASTEEIEDLVAWVLAHSPVGTDIASAVAPRIVIERI